MTAPDAYIIPLLERAEPAFTGFQDLLHVERMGLPPLKEGGPPALVIRFYFHPVGDTTIVQSADFICNPDGAVEHDIATPEQVDHLFASFPQETPTTEESAK